MHCPANLASLPACACSGYGAVRTMQLPAVCRTAAYSSSHGALQAKLQLPALSRTAYIQARLLMHLPALLRAACIQATPLLPLCAMRRTAHKHGMLL